MIVSGRGGRWARYGCSQNWNLGTCKNDLTVNRQFAEQTLLNKLDLFGTNPNGLDFVFDELRKAFTEVMNNSAGSRSELQTRKAQIEGELENLAVAIRQGVPAKTLRKSLADGERELARLTAKLKDLKPLDIEAQLDDMRNFALSKIASLPMLFREEPSAARWELRKHMSEIWMTPVRNAEGNRYYIGVGQWNSVDDDFTSSLRHIFDLIYERRTTGVGSLAVVLPSSNEEVRYEKDSWRDLQNLESVEREWDATCPGLMRWLQNRNATGAKLDCGVRSVAGAGFEPATFGL